MSTPHRRIYVASSWRNPDQPIVVQFLRDLGHEVYDFRNPKPGDQGFSWRQITDEPRPWYLDYGREILEHPIARNAFDLDHGGMAWADTFVMLLPCGNSAHLELGWACGAGKQAFVFSRDLVQVEPELMWREVLATGGGLVVGLEQLARALDGPAVVPASPMKAALARLSGAAENIRNFDETDTEAEQDASWLELAAALDEADAVLDVDPPAEAASAPEDTTSIRSMAIRAQDVADRLGLAPREYFLRVGPSTEGEDPTPVWGPSICVLARSEWLRVMAGRQARVRDDTLEGIVDGVLVFTASYRSSARQGSFVVPGGAADPAALIPHAPYSDLPYTAQASCPRHG